MERINFLGVKIDNLTMEETINKVKKIIAERIPTQHVVMNASKTVMVQKNKKIKSIINDCAIVNADGQSIVWASKLLGKGLKERVTGIDLMNHLFKVSEVHGYKIYLFGATQEVIETVVEIIHTNYPDIEIAGYRNGYFSSEDNAQIVSDIEKSGADLLFVGFSSPMKEYWLAENLKRLNVPFCMGVGGSFDVLSGKTIRAPLWMQKTGLEWFYRLSQEPGRMWKRYLVGNALFMYYVFKEKFGLTKEL